MDVMVETVASEAIICEGAHFPEQFFWVVSPHFIQCPLVSAEVAHL